VGGPRRFFATGSQRWCRVTCQIFPESPCPASASARSGGA
jgi:hypothetical protein